MVILIHRDTEINPVRCFNAHTKRPCRFILRVPGLPADNPQQSEEASHIGGNGNMPCRKCHVGGPHESTESDEGYDAFHYVSPCFVIHWFCHTDGVIFYAGGCLPECPRNTR